MITPHEKDAIYKLAPLSGVTIFKRSVMNFIRLMYRRATVEYNSSLTLQEHELLFRIKRAYITGDKSNGKRYKKVSK